MKDFNIDELANKFIDNAPFDNVTKTEREAMVKSFKEGFNAEPTDFMKNLFQPERLNPEGAKQAQAIV